MRQTLTEIKKGQVGTGLLIENDGFISLHSNENKALFESIQLKEDGTRNIPYPFIVSAVFQKYGVENANGRIYPEDILKREVEKYQKAIQERRAYGEANHPNESSIDISRIALNIIELHWEGRTLVGKIEIPITDGFRKFGIISNCADELAHLLLSGLKLGVSSRALGSVTQRGGILYVGDDLELVCWDAVTNPSTPGAYIANDTESLRPYIQENENNEHKEIIEDKLSKFENWLND